MIYLDLDLDIKFKPKSLEEILSERKAREQRFKLAVAKTKKKVVQKEVAPQTLKTMKQVCSEVASRYKRHGVSYGDLFSTGRSGKAVVARYEMFYKCCHETSNNFAEIARYFKKDRTTVLYGVRKYTEYVKKNKWPDYMPKDLEIWVDG